MLVLSRKKGQSIQIGDGITITVTQVSGGKVRLGISAPPEVAIRRSELELETDEPMEADRRSYSAGSIAFADNRLPAPLADLIETVEGAIADSGRTIPSRIKARLLARLYVEDRAAGASPEAIQALLTGILVSLEEA